MGKLLSGILRKNQVVFGLLVLIAFILYLPVLTNNFLADDYRVMNRVGLDGEVFVQGFFRPLSDISLYVNYLLAGFDPFVYYLTNIFFHAGCSFLIYLFCKRTDLIPTFEDDNPIFACFAALLFLTYPFHNESIAWIVGRASLLATFFGLACLLVATGTAKLKGRYFLGGLFYFIGLLAYESIFPLPAIILMLIWVRHRSLPMIVRWISVFVIAIALHLVLRIYFSGVVTGEYGQEIFSPDILRYVTNVFKIIGRMLLPPSDNSVLLVIFFLVLVSSYLVVRLLRKSRPGLKFNGGIIENRIILLLAIALIVPLTFSVSTRTSEGDRLLYFPSVFLCIFFAYLLVTRIHRSLYRTIVLCCLLIYNIVFLEINNAHWKKASGITDSVLEQVSSISKKPGSILLFNVPGEYKGAYIFRNAFEEALFIKGTDTSAVQAVNYLNHSEYQLLPDTILPYRKTDSVYIGKSVVLFQNSVTVRDFNKPWLPARTILLSGDEKIWYWNKHKFVLLTNL